MKIIMSPAKKMRSDEDASMTPTTPRFLKESQILEEKLKSMYYDELRRLWKTNESLTHQCFESYRSVSLNLLHVRFMHMMGLLLSIFILFL